MAVHSDRSSLTEGVIWKKIVLFAFPIFLGNLFQQLYNTVDSLIVGWFLGDQALAAVASSGNLIFMFIGFFNGLAMGAGVVIARCYGAKEYREMEDAIHTDVAFGLLTGAVITVLGVAMTPTILRWMDTPEDVLPSSISYFRLYFCGALFTVMYNIFVGILHSMGDSKHPLYYLLATSAMNVVLDLLFVGVLHMGVGAAALATTLSQGASALLCCIRMLRLQRPGRMEIRKIRIRKDSLRQIIRYGLPAGVQNSVIGFANVVVQGNINAFGSAAMAGCGAYSKLEGFAFLPITCFAQGLTTFVGQNLGARKFDRVVKGARFATICSVTLAEVVGILMYIFIPQLIGLFNGSGDVVAFGVRHARVTCLFFFLLAFSHCSAGILRGAGQAKVPMITMLCCWCLLRVTYITVAVQFFPRLETVSWAYPLTWSCSSMIFLYCLLKTDWIHTFQREQAAHLKK